MSQSKIITQPKVARVQEFNQILKRLQEFYDYPSRQLVNHLYTEHGYSQEKIAEIIGFSESIISQRFPKKEASK